jgi:hypothetical protein
MRPSPGRRLIIALIGLALCAVPALLIKGIVGDKIDDANTAAGFQNIPANAIDIEDSQSLYRTENFDAALSALEDHAGANPELLSVGVQPYMAEFQVKDGQKAKGYRYYAKNGEMGEFKVKLIGPGSIDGSQFPYETVRVGITQKLAAAVARRDGGLRVTNMTIQRGIIEGDLVWSVNSESDARTGIVFQADPDGSGLADATERALERADTKSGSPTTDALSQADCLQQAGGDVAKVEACVQ